MKTVWEYSLDSEAYRLIHCAHKMVTGFYRINSFYVLPYDKLDHDSSVITLPDLPYCKIPRFWERVKKISTLTFPLKVEKNLINEIKKLLIKIKLPTPDITKTQEIWNKAQYEVINEIEKIIPTKKGMISQIKIWPTVFGSSVSFNQPRLFPETIYMFLRQDQDIYAITEAILSALTRDEMMHDLEGLWQESELVVDWLLTKSSLNKVLKHFQPKTTFVPTIKYTRLMQKASILQQSEKFYRKLGIPLKKEFFTIKAEKPLINGKPVYQLSSREEKILTFLIKKKNDIVTFDEIANLIFTNDDEFSLYAIAKIIQRLRDKLEQNGLSGTSIQTLRGQGYLLKN